MCTLSLLTSFLIFLILLTSSFKNPTLAQTNATITDKLIHEICNNTRNPSLCLNNLKPLKGKSLFPHPIATFGSNSINMAQSRANGTVALTWANYRGVTVHKPELRMKYYKCFLEYTDVRNQLKQDKKYMVSGAVRSVKKYVSIAVNRVNYCDVELKKPPREQSGMVLEANGVFEDLCSVILAICDKSAKVK